MAAQIVFFHGGGSYEDYQADQQLANSLQNELGEAYLIHYPYLPNDSSPDLGRRQQIQQEIEKQEDGVILAAHSLGASMLLAYLSENDIEKKIAGIFLLATPFWQGNEDWVEAFKLNSDFAEKLDEHASLFFYHCQDDEEVSFDHFLVYKDKLPRAHFHAIEKGGHQFTAGLGKVAEDIRKLG